MYDWRPGGFGVYLHWPFCQSKCPYCDFNSHVATQIDQAQWRAAFLSEIARYAEEAKNRVVQTIYFGGGTPSLMEPTLVADLISAIRAAWPTVNDLEVTLEANPGSVEAGRLQGYRQAGVNRVSLGVQALNDDALRLLGRMHSKQEAWAALEIAFSTFDRVSFDLIYARQFQSLDDWRNELTEALAMGSGHLSLYQLTVEDGTVFSQRAKRGKLPGLPGEDLAADMFEMTQELAEAAGLPPYEVSNHAKLGAESRHNMIYWRGGDYVGIGPGAHGRISLDSGRFATESHRSPGTWLDRVSRRGNGESARNRLSSDDIALEYLLMSLRTIEGLDLGRYEATSGRPLSSARINGLKELGLLETAGGFLRTTRAGRPLLNAILRDLAV